MKYKTEGERIRFAREKKGITKTELSRRMGVHFNSIGNWETNKIQVRGSVRLALANLLSVNVEWLRTGEAPMNLQEQPYTFAPRPETQIAEAWAENLADPPYVGKAIAVLMRALRRRGLDMDDERAGKIVMALVKRAQETGKDPAEEWAIEEIIKPGGERK